MTDPLDQEIPALRDWLESVAEDLNLPSSVVVPGPLLDVARDVAHGIIRPGAPTTTYLIGVAVGLQLAGEDWPAEDVAELVNRLSYRVQDLASDYEPAQAAPNQPTPNGA